MIFLFLLWSVSGYFPSFKETKTKALNVFQISKYKGYPMHKAGHYYLLVKVPGYYEKYNLKTH